MTPPSGARDPDPARHLRDLRASKGMSLGDVAKASGLGRRQIAAFERGRSSMSETDLVALAGAYGVEPSALVPPGYFLTLAGRARAGNGGDPRGEAPLDTLLREYLSMLVELRGTSEGLAASLRHEDLKELARALGGTPEAIEAKVMDLLATDRYEASDIVRTFMPSYDQNAEPRY